MSRTDTEVETPILWLPNVKSWLILKYPDARKDWRQEKGTTEDDMVGCHYRVNEHEFEHDMGDGDGQRSLACHGLQTVGIDWETEQQQHMPRKDPWIPKSEDNSRP